MSRPRKEGPVLGQVVGTVTEEDLDADVEMSSEQEQEQEQDVEQPPERYFKVTLFPRQNEQEEERVPLAVNGEVLYAKRGDTIILPERFINMMDDAIMPLYSGKVGEDGRQQIGALRRVGYQMGGEATEAEYLALRKRGDLAIREYRRMVTKENR